MGEKSITFEKKELDIIQVLKIVEYLTKWEG